MSAVKTPTREAGLARLADFAARAGRDYAATRNEDRGPEDRANVSGLSPYVRRRMVSEREIVEAALAHHGAQAAEKFVQEVYWRTYWKGRLEMQPAAWTRYLKTRDDDFEALRRDKALAQAYREAVEGRTGIEAFDAWARELDETGELHNHARMWFSSIWIFTLNLPWALGADLFLRRLIDADPASNTLSWRWTAGLQTKGKTYLARASNIARFTGGRLSAEGLSPRAEALEEEPLPAPEPRAWKACAAPAGDAVLLLHDDDLGFETLDLGAARITRALLLTRMSALSPEPVGAASQAFTEGALEDARARLKAAYGLDEVPILRDAESLVDALADRGATRLVVPYAPVGPVADALAEASSGMERADTEIEVLVRPWDAETWPFATKGFFGLKKRIPERLVADGLIEPGAMPASGGRGKRRR